MPIPAGSTYVLPDTASRERTMPSGVRPKRIGEFFMIDARVIPPLCAGGINPALAYLTLACGTGRDNATTAWSATSLQKYVGIHHSRGKLALAELIGRRFIDQLAGGARPRYRLRPAEDVPGSAGFPREALNPQEQAAYERLAETSDGIVSPLAESLLAKGWAWRAPDGALERARLALEPSPVWLPNALVRGVKDPHSPLRQLREAQDPLLLRLLLDLYRAHDLAGEGGVDRDTLSRNYRRVEIGQRGIYTIWGFAPATTAVWRQELMAPHRVQPTDEDRNGLHAWRARLTDLEDLRLIEWIPTLFDSPDPAAEPIHPCGMGDTDAIEHLLGRAAHEAGRAMITENQMRWAYQTLGSSLQLVPVERHRREVEMVGIVRLAFRPRTRATAAWQARRNEQHAQVERYRRLAGNLQSA
jgi:hypothetical protein